MYRECDQCGAIANHSLELADTAPPERQLGNTTQRMADAGGRLTLDRVEDFGS